MRWLGVGRRGLRGHVASGGRISAAVGYVGTWLLVGEFKRRGRGLSSLGLCGFCSRGRAVQAFPRLARAPVLTVVWGGPLEAAPVAMCV